MITDTISRMMQVNKYPKHPYMRAYWGYYRIGNFKKRLINWFKNIFK